ncbi:hypothetical protein DRO54_06680 [Candidatus Bathyarchaeota archaeon]|nr:MAG: hypothetical protein DRO54_06680 [Candidatus Bathyarchaeota archaeon]
MVEQNFVWHLALDREQRDVVMDALRRKLQACRTILQNKWKYGKYTVEKAKRESEVCEWLLKTLGWKEGKKEVVVTKKEKTIDERVKNLEMKVANMEIILKKLVAYHEGDIK